MTATYIAFLSGFAWLAIQMLGLLALTALLTWLLCRLWYGRKNPEAVAGHHGSHGKHAAPAKDNSEKTIANLRGQLEKERSSQSKAKSELTTARAELESLRTKLAGFEKYSVPASKLQAAEAAQNQAVQELKAIKDGSEKLRRDFETAKSERQILANKIQELSLNTVPTEKWNEAQRGFETASKEADALKAEDATRTAKARQTQEILENLRREHNRSLDELAKLRNELGSRTEARDEIASSQIQNQAATKLKEMEDERNKLALELDQLRRASVPKGDLINLKAALAEKEKEAAAAREQIAKLTRPAALTPVQAALDFEPPMAVPPQDPPSP